MFNRSSSQHHSLSRSSQAHVSGRRDGNLTTTARAVTQSSSSHRNGTHLPSRLDSHHPSSSSARRQTPTHMPSRLDASPSSAHRDATNLTRDTGGSSHNATNLHRDQSNPSSAPAPTGTAYTDPHDVKMASRQTMIESLPPEERKEQDEWVREQLHLSVCPVGFLWDRIDGGYVCQGGSHLVTDELLAEGRGAYYIDNSPHFYGERIWLGPIYPAEMLPSLYLAHRVRRRHIGMPVSSRQLP